jgi:hypothetical protein
MYKYLLIFHCIFKINSIMTSWIVQRDTRLLVCVHDVHSALMINMINGLHLNYTEKNVICINILSMPGTSHLSFSQLSQLFLQYYKERWRTYLKDCYGTLICAVKEKKKIRKVLKKSVVILNIMAIDILKNALYIFIFIFIIYNWKSLWFIPTFFLFYLVINYKAHAHKFTSLFCIFFLKVKYRKKYKIKSK